MAERITPSKGSKPEKLMRDAIIMELHREATGADGVMTKRLRLVASALVNKAAEGDVQAIKEINDRVDGKAPQSVDLTGEIAATVMFKTVYEQAIGGKP
jgi:hypothetical protein